MTAPAKPPSVVLLSPRLIFYQNASSCWMNPIAISLSTTATDLITMPGRKSGGADLAFYQSPHTIAQFDHLKEPLARDLGLSRDEADSLSGESLALLTHALQQFQEDVLGADHAKNARSLHRAPARIPAKVFRSDSISPSSPIFQVLYAAYQYRQKNGWHDWDLANPAKQAQYIDLISHIRETLVRNGVFKNPCVAFSESVSAEEREALTPIINQLGGE